MNQNLFLQQADKLEIYAKDLFYGTKKFQEFIIEALNQHKLTTPDDVPKMMKIKSIIEGLKIKQQELFESFTSIKALLETRKMFKKTQAQLKIIQAHFTELDSFVQSKKFKKVLKRLEKLMQPLQSKEINRLVSSLIKLKLQPA